MSGRLRADVLLRVVHEQTAIDMVMPCSHTLYKYCSRWSTAQQTIVKTQMEACHKESERQCHVQITTSLTQEIAS